MRLAQFIESAENRSAVLAVRRVAHAARAGRLPRDGMPLFLFGPPGVGKSHLVQGLIASLSEASSPLTARLLAATDFGLDWSSDADSELLQACTECDLLIVEDLQHVPNRAVSAFARIVDRRMSRHLPIVATANVGPGQLRELPPRLASQLGGGLVVGLDLPNPTTRRYLLERFAQRERLPTAPGVLDWLAEQTSGGVRPLLGAISTLKAITGRSAQPPSLVKVQQLWHDLSPERPAPDIDRILQHVARFYALAPKELAGRGRQARTLWPLQVAMYLVRERTGLPWSRIGDALGGRDPSTVRHAARKVAQRIDRDPAVASAIRQLAAEVA